MLLEQRRAAFLFLKPREGKPDRHRVTISHRLLGKGAEFSRRHVKSDAFWSRIEIATAAGLTQTELAAKLGEYQSFVARLESGQRRVDVVEFLEFAELLDFDPHDALDELKRIKG